MKTVFMPDTDHSPENGLFGQCLRACVASIFDLELHEVPHFANEWLHPDGLGPDEGTEQVMREWLEPQGFVLMCFRVPAEAMPEAIQNFKDANMDAHHLLGGLSALGQPHSVVGRYGEVAHDPWPLLDDPNRGLLLPDHDGFELGFFVKR